MTLTETTPSEDYVQVDVRITSSAPGFTVGHALAWGWISRTFSSAEARSSRTSGKKPVKDQTARKKRLPRGR